MISKHALPPLALALSACASSAASAADPGVAEQRQCPAYPLPPADAAQAAGEDRLPAADALTATEQAIQLDELIKWVTASRPRSGCPMAGPPPDREPAPIAAPPSSG